jgi:hypothetical protein
MAQVAMILVQVAIILAQVAMILAQVRKNGGNPRHGKNANN